MEPLHIRDGTPWDYNGIPYSDVFWVWPSRKTPTHCENSSPPLLAQGEGQTAVIRKHPSMKLRSCFRGVANSVPNNHAAFPPLA